MDITLRPETEKLLQEQMTRANCRDADALIHAALSTFQEVEGEPLEELDSATQADIARAEAQSSRGEGRPWPEVKGDLQRRLFGT